MCRFWFVSSVFKMPKMLPPLESHEKYDPEFALLSAQEVSRYRSLVMRANYLSLDRPDVSYTAKELARKMSETESG